MSLQGVKIALTASRERCEAISFLLEDEGADLVHLRLLELRPPSDARPFAAMVEQLPRHPWILLSSLEAVAALWDGARVAGTLPGLSKVGFIAADAAVARMLTALGQPPRFQLPGPLPLEADTEVLVPLGDASSPWPRTLAEAGALAISVLAWTPADVALPDAAPQLILFESPGTPSALHRDRPQWLDGAVRVAGSASVADELLRLGFPAHTVARGGSLELLDAAQAAWKR